MSATSVALAHARRRARLAERLRREARRAWSLVDRNNISASWAAQVPRLLWLLAAAQRDAAGTADDYLSAVLAAQGVTTDTAGVNPDAFAGLASDGRDLASLLARPGIVAKTAIGAGWSVDRAMTAGGALAQLAAHTQVADAGRTADQVALVARPQARGYVRMVVGKTCSRCLILAGATYRWNAGFRRHPKCFPAGVVVDGPRSEAATRRLYQGELVVLATASGQKLPLTGNHPVLTRRGWVPARLLQKGDDVVRRARAEGATALVVPGHDQVPARIEDVWGALGVPFLDAVESSPEDFHGDGQHGKVDVVRADGAFDGRIFAALPQHLAQHDLASATRSAFTLNREGVAKLLDLTNAPHSGGPVRVEDLRPALFGRLLRRPDGARLAHAATLDPGFGEDAGDRAARDAVLLGEAELAGPGQVCGHDGLGWQVENLARWDAPDDAFSVETRVGYAARGLDLLQRLSGQVELDRLVEVCRVEWSGHVYSLTSAEGWHSANSLIVSNCDCIHIPAAEDAPGDLHTYPEAAFEAMDVAEQDRVFGKAGAQAIREGADMGQVVNARRGMRTAADGRLYTTEAAGRRPRLMPEQVYREAGSDRADAIRLLRLHGYLLDRVSILPPPTDSSPRARRED